MMALAFSSSRLDAAYEHCAEIVRARDDDRWLASLFAPRDARRHLLALYAFNAEVARVRDVVSDPLPGEMRLQWWRDFIEGKARGAAEANPIATALNDTIIRHALPRKAFADLLEARSFDLYDDPMPSLDSLFAYCADTSSTLIRLGACILTGDSAAGDTMPAAKAGLAYALTGLLRALPWHAARGQVFLPKDLLDRHGVSREDIVAGRAGAGLMSVLAQLRAEARAALAATRAGVSAIVPAAVPAFLPVAFVEPYLNCMERADYQPFRSHVDVTRLRKLVILWRQNRRARR